MNLLDSLSLNSTHFKFYDQKYAKYIWIPKSKIVRGSYGKEQLWFKARYQNRVLTILVDKETWENIYD